jgi:hypothetical protein
LTSRRAWRYSLRYHPSTKIPGGKKEMATPAAPKFVQIATSSAVVADRLFTIVHALDEKGNVWQYQSDERSTISKGKWIPLSNDRR